MELIVLSRSKTIQYCHAAHDQLAVIISVSDPNMVYTTRPFCSTENRICAILPLMFCDADRPGKDVYGNETNVNDLMSNSDAKKVARFVRLHKDKRIIVHCDAGISRSAGIAAAIMKHYTNDDAEYFYSGQYCPNMWCYRKTLEALVNEDTDLD